MTGDSTNPPHSSDPPRNKKKKQLRSPEQILAPPEPPTTRFQRGRSYPSTIWGPELRAGLSPHQLSIWFKSLMYLEVMTYPILSNNSYTIYPWIVCPHKMDYNQLQRGYDTFCAGGGCCDPTAAQQSESLGRNARWADGTIN